MIKDSKQQIYHKIINNKTYSVTYVCTNFVVYISKMDNLCEINNYKKIKS